MRCPFCGANRDRVVDSRELREGATIRRRRECLECESRFTSYENIEDIPFRVVKRDGRREDFQRSKLMAGLKRATEKRPIETQRLEEIVDAVEQTLRRQEKRELPTEEIGRTIMDELRELDHVAYVRFASVYRNFEDVGEFMEELEGLISRTRIRPPKA